MKKDQQFYPDFLVTPYQLFRHPELEPLDRDVYAVVYWFEHLKDGECRASNATIANIANVEPRSVQNALTRLEKLGFIERVYKDKSERHRVRIITKIAYSKVRTRDDSRKQSEPRMIPERTTDDSQSEPRMTRYSNSKRVIEDSNTMSANADEFDKFWQVYPKKEMKKKSEEVWRSKRLDSKAEEIIEFVKRALLTDRWRNGYIKQPPVFLRNECWNDDLSAYGEIKSKRPENVLDQGREYRQQALKKLSDKTIKV